VGLDIPVGDPETAGARPPTKQLDLCATHLALEVKAFLALMPHLERIEWIARVRGTQGAAHGG
jgi:hypothetical protein